MSRQHYRDQRVVPTAEGGCGGPGEDGMHGIDQAVERDEHRV